MANPTNVIAGAGAVRRMGHPLSGITSSWISKIHAAHRFKRGEFQNDADECMRFFDGPHDFMYKNDATARSAQRSDSSFPNPTFRMTYNRVAEMVQLFGPVLYHRNPHRQITPRELPVLPIGMFGDPQDPQVQQMVQQLTEQFEQVKNRDEVLASLMQSYLNYTPNEMLLKEHSRQAIDEAIIKGMGILWPEVFTPPGAGHKVIRSVFESCDNILFDSDMESMENATWCARKRIIPVWMAEDKFQLPRGTLHGNLESFKNQTQDQESDYYRRRGETNDIITYWEVYSRMGMGHLLKDRAGLGSHSLEYRTDDSSTKFFDKFGTHVFLAVCDDYPIPLNLAGANVKKFDDMFFRAQWPIPFWADPTDPWPFVVIQFHRRPRKVYPMSHLKPGLGELKFLNWAISFVADKIKNTCRDFIGVLKSAEEDLKTQILSGKDLTLIEIERQHGKTINDVVSFLQHPQMNGDIWKVIDAVMKVFEDRVGLNEMMYGESKKQLRSAAEANVKGSAIKVRPEDMATKVEEAMTLLARKEALAARWFLDAKDVEPVFGEVHAKMWTQFVQNTEVPQVVAEFTYRIEAGSIRKPNRDRDVENANQATQVWTPIFNTYFQQTGDVRPINALIGMWAKAFDLDPKDFTLQPPPPPEGPSPEEQQMAMKEKESQTKVAVEQQKAQMDALKKAADVQAGQAKAEVDVQKAMAELIMADRKGQMELAFSTAEHQQEMAQAREKGAMERALMQAKAKSGNGEKR